MPAVRVCVCVHSVTKCRVACVHFLDSRLSGGGCPQCNGHCIPDDYNALNKDYPHKHANKITDPLIKAYLKATSVKRSSPVRVGHSLPLTCCAPPPPSPLLHRGSWTSHDSAMVIVVWAVLEMSLQDVGCDLVAPSQWAARKAQQLRHASHCIVHPAASWEGGSCIQVIWYIV